MCVLTCLHVVACVLSLCVIHAFFCANEISVCSKHSLICSSPICSMCNSDNPCRLHVCAWDASVCFVWCLCTFLGVIFWSWPLWIEAFFSHLLLSCWLSKAGESKQTRAHSKRKLSGPHSWADLAGLVGGVYKGGEGRRRGDPLCTRLRAPAPLGWGAVYPPLCTSCNLLLPSETLSSLPYPSLLPFTSLLSISYSYSLPLSFSQPPHWQSLHHWPCIAAPSSLSPLTVNNFAFILFFLQSFFFLQKTFLRALLTCYAGFWGCGGWEVTQGEIRWTNRMGSLSQILSYVHACTPLLFKCGYLKCLVLS